MIKAGILIAVRMVTQLVDVTSIASLGRALHKTPLSQKSSAQQYALLDDSLSE
jgi:hypothetical protein